MKPGIEYSLRSGERTMSGMAWNEESIRHVLQVYFIMGSNNCHSDSIQVLAEAIEGGITLFQFREKGTGALQGEALVKLARQLRQLCRRRGVPFIVNDDVNLAIAVDADGVHIGQEDEEAEAVRSRIGGRLLGVSAYNQAEAEAAIRAGADYLGVGPLYTTRTKEDAKAAFGPGVIREMREQGLRIPIVGIGGITETNAREVVRAGADGVSVITAISHAEQPRLAVKSLRRAVQTAGEEEGERNG